jgi:hypothetical protein
VSLADPQVIAGPSQPKTRPAATIWLQAEGISVARRCWSASGVAAHRAPDDEHPLCGRLKSRRCLGARSANTMLPGRVSAGAAVKRQLPLSRWRLQLPVAGRRG